MRVVITTYFAISRALFEGAVAMACAEEAIYMVSHFCSSYSAPSSTPPLFLFFVINNSLLSHQRCFHERSLPTCGVLNTYDRSCHSTHRSMTCILYVLIYHLQYMLLMQSKQDVREVIETIHVGRGWSRSSLR